MSDLYTELLDLPAGTRPPTYYQLLGVSPLTEDAEAIVESAKRQLRRLRATVGDGRERLIQEVEQALATLLDPERRQAYDDSLTDAKSTAWWEGAVSAESERESAPEPVKLPWWAESDDPLTSTATRGAAGTLPEVDAHPDAISVGPEDVVGESLSGSAAHASPRAPRPLPAWATPENCPADMPPPPVVQVAASARRKIRIQTILVIGFLIAAGVGIIFTIGLFINRQAWSNRPSPPEQPPPPLISNNPPPLERQLKPNVRQGNPRPLPSPNDNPLPNEPPTEPMSENPSVVYTPKPPEAEAGARVYRGHDGPIQAVAIHPKGGLFYSQAADQEVIAWTFGDARVRWRSKLTAPCIGVVVLPGDRGVLAATEANVHLLDDRGTVTQRYTSPRGNFTGLALLPDGTAFLTAGSDGTVRRWNIQAGKEEGLYDVHPTEPVLCLAISADGTALVTGCRDGSIVLWDVESREKIAQQSMVHSGGVSAVAISPGRERIASAGADRTLRIWDGKLSQSLRQPTPLEQVPLDLAFASDQWLFAAGSADPVRLWDLESGQTIGSFDAVFGANAIDVYGKTLLVGDREGSLREYTLP